MPSLERCLGCSLMTGTPMTTSCSVFPCICSHAHPVAVSCLPPGPFASVGYGVEGVVVVRRDTAERGTRTDTHPHTTMPTQQRAPYHHVNAATSTGRMDTQQEHKPQDPLARLQQLGRKAARHKTLQSPAEFRSARHPCWSRGGGAGSWRQCASGS